MATQNFLNVYEGVDSVKRFYDPDLQPLLPLVEIPSRLNPFRQDGVRIYAKMMTMLPANNVKALPALNMLSSSVNPGKTTTIIEYSSGSTVVSMSVIARALYGISDVRAFLSNKTTEAKLRLMQFFGLNITLFGGPSQPEPCDSRGGIQRARREAEKSDSVVNPNQYENDDNWKAHFNWTGPQIIKQLPDVSVVCAGMGTSGTMTGIGTYLKQSMPAVVRVGVCTAPGDRVPGPRSKALLAPVLFPWQDAVDTVEEVGSIDSYSLSMELSREGLICGPSSGFNLKGLLKFLTKCKDSGTLKDLVNEDGEIKCVFLCCDLPYQYINDYFAKLDQDHFHPIRNKNLGAVDLYRYDDSWELDQLQAFAAIYDYESGASLEGTTTEVLLRRDALIIDLRAPEDFMVWNMPLSTNQPIKTLSRDTPSPFSDPNKLEEQWLELDSLFGNAKAGTLVLNGTRIPAQPVLLLCYDGDTSRVSTSVLRARGVEALSLRGGLNELLESKGKEIWAYNTHLDYTQGRKRKRV
ncbi:tryptophan synthase beta subunit-like PLP-dependent enzyme [Glonium stellatum]|uniref:Tryptophan synthase beta subunit-like PLP-dependent enzyme n=1 Tax=Glonium stellatum TaxID=574774 RepID=A0A8E2FCG7_9PEZI|nr:tryptophan synthase beta subunit-like PLP-dependent enzyme [Glonium stellatum]